jgi:hypothetical protein
MVGLGFTGKCISKLMSEIASVPCINNVIKLYHYLNGSFFCFQALTAFALLTTVYRCLLNKQCARINRSYSGSHRRWAVPGGRQKGGWP